MLHHHLEPGPADIILQGAKQTYREKPSSRAPLQPRSFLDSGHIHATFALLWWLDLLSSPETEAGEEVGVEAALGIAKAETE